MTDFWGGRRVLVTGHTGFKGSWLTLWLLRYGADVYGFSLPPDNTHNLYEILQLEKQSQHPELSGCLHHYLGELRSSDELVSAVDRCQPEIVFHLAAQSLVRKSYTDTIGTWSTNLMGSLNLLETLKAIGHSCAVVMITTDKVYENREWIWGYREVDQLGGHDPYSASKAAMELMISSWRDSFCGMAAHQTPHLAIASARAGNVIGGGDWAEDRIVPDAMRSLATHEPIPVRQPLATRPWQHVLEPLGGYLQLAEKLFTAMAPPKGAAKPTRNPFATAFNFGPTLEANRNVRELVEKALQHWPGSWSDHSDPNAPHEAGRLHLQIDKAHHLLGWQPRWDFSTTVARTVNWYRNVHEGASAIQCCLKDLTEYEDQARHAN